MRRWVVVLTGIGSLMAALDTLVASTALPTIRVDLGASLGQLEWTVNAYNLSFAALLTTGPALGDRFGRRRFYAAGLGLFALASAGCALAPDGYVQAWERNDVDAIAAMLTATATLAMPPTPTWFRGRDAVAAGLRAGPLAAGVRWRLTPTRANGQLAATADLWSEARQGFAPHGITVLTLRGGLVHAITAFHDTHPL